MAKHSLSHLMDTTDPMDLHQLGTFLSTVAATVNSRPLGLSRSQEGDLTPLTPGDLLVGKLGHTHQEVQASIDMLDEEDTNRYVREMMTGKM